jgi:alpha-D-ribose 1-methylphosphonate 5-triphosphate diphosphatase PhnM
MIPAFKTVHKNVKKKKKYQKRIQRKSNNKHYNIDLNNKKLIPGLFRLHTGLNSMNAHL